MKILHTVSEMRALSKLWHTRSLSIALVPTMGYLHAGHLSLLTEAKKHADRIIVSIFVNPTQFGVNEDLDAYPRDLAHDAALCQEYGADIIFHPEIKEMYFPDHSTWVNEEALSQSLCGASRPGHFRGVTSVVLKLFNICSCDFAVFGLKDAQQALVIQRMCRDLNLPVKLLFAPLVRETDGLAMSSRNKYLSAEERKKALSIYRGLTKAQKLFRQGCRNTSQLKECVHGEIVKQGGRIDYVEVMDRTMLKPLTVLDRPALLAVAVFFGTTRLIDNLWLD